MFRGQLRDESSKVLCGLFSVSYGSMAMVRLRLWKVKPKERKKKREKGIWRAWFCEDC